MVDDRCLCEYLITHSGEKHLTEMTEEEYLVAAERARKVYNAAEYHFRTKNTGWLVTTLKTASDEYLKLVMKHRGNSWKHVDKTLLDEYREGFYGEYFVNFNTGELLDIKDTRVCVRDRVKWLHYKRG